MTFDQWADRHGLTPAERKECLDLLGFTRCRKVMEWLLRCYEQEAEVGEPTP